MSNRKYKVLDLIGKRFGKLTVLDFDHQNGRRLYYICKCDCGNICIKSNDSLIQSKLDVSCGCIKEDLAKSDIINKKFNSLTVLSFDHTEPWTNIENKNVYYFKCRCDCGKELILPKAYITTGKVKSCNECKDKIKSSINHNIQQVEFLDNGFVKFIDSNKLVRILNDPRDMIGKTIGKYTITSIYGVKQIDALSYEYYYNCQCSCGHIDILGRKYLKYHESKCNNICCQFCKENNINNKQNKLYCPIKFLD